MLPCSSALLPSRTDRASSEPSPDWPSSCTSAFGDHGQRTGVSLTTRSVAASDRAFDRRQRCVPEPLDTVVVGVAFGGCLTLDPTITVETSDSTVFESLSATEPRTGSGVRVNATLRSTGAADNVTQLTVIKANGRSIQTIGFDSGQTTVILTVPANQNSTVVASNTANSTTLALL